MHAHNGLLIETGQPTSTVEWGWAYQNRIIPVESEDTAQTKVDDNGGRAVCRLKVQPAPLVGAWVDPLTKSPDFIQRTGEENEEDQEETVGHR